MQRGKATAQKRAKMSQPFAMQLQGRGAQAPKPADIEAIWGELYAGINEIYDYKKRKMSMNRYMILYT